jgi:formylmethanofuran dehydrogenase subunit E
METLKELFDTGLKFHGHKCPAVPLGLRAGVAAMKALGVERSKNKELVVESETGESHAVSCFLDGVMVATGCTYGKGNIRKLNYNKMAFTLIDTKTRKAVRVSLKPDFFEKALNSPFVQELKKGVQPQDIPTLITDPIVDRIFNLSESELLSIGEVFHRKAPMEPLNFDVQRCSKCGETVFTDKLTSMSSGRLLCIPCAGSEK